jgi:alpha-galactosidase
MKVVEMRKSIRQYAGPDHWNDPDMLEVGNGMAENEDRAHFSLWCMMAAPLIAGNDIRTVAKSTSDILTNLDVIAVDQDSLGVQGFRYTTTPEGIEVWAKPLVHGDWAICLLNRSESSRDVSVHWREYSMNDDISKQGFDPGASTYAIRDLWQQRAVGTTQEVLHSTIHARDVVLMRLTKQR